MFDSNCLKGLYIIVLLTGLTLSPLSGQPTAMIKKTRRASGGMEQQNRIGMNGSSRTG